MAPVELAPVQLGSSEVAPKKTRVSKKVTVSEVAAVEVLPVQLGSGEVAPKKTRVSKKVTLSEVAPVSSKEVAPKKTRSSKKAVSGEVAPTKSRNSKKTVPVEVASTQLAKKTRSSKKASIDEVAPSQLVKKTRSAKKTTRDEVVQKSNSSEATTDGVTSTEKQVRSFKVQLPGAENYEGRFTGLTPYQAANKALSKYYRENKEPTKEIKFSIRESTRGSKRAVYTYNGRRDKLTVPVEYAIKEGRTIIKNFKNHLVKVKKHDLTGGANPVVEA